MMMEWLPKKTGHRSERRAGHRQVSGASTRQEATPQAPVYRRNRTMTDRSTIPEVSERARLHYLRSVRRRIGFALGVTAFVAVVIVIGISQFTGSVRIVVSASDPTTRPLDANYQQLIDRYYQKHPFERFRFLTNYDALTMVLQADAPEIAKIAPSGVDSLSVSRLSITMRRPVASWTVEDTRYYVDADGITFLRNYYQEPKASVIDNSGVQVAKGTAVASNRLLSFVGRVVSLLGQDSITVVSIEVPSGSTRQLLVKGEGTPSMKMTSDGSAEGQVSDAVRAIRYLSDKKESVGYIDVRVDGRVFYK